MAKKNTPVGVKLSELVAVYKRQNQPLPPEIQKLLDEQSAQATPKDAVKPPTVPSEPQSAQPTTSTQGATEAAPAAPDTQKVTQQQATQALQPPSSKPPKTTRIRKSRHLGRKAAHGFIRGLAGKAVADSLIKMPPPDRASKEDAILSEVRGVWADVRKVRKEVQQGNRAKRVGSGGGVKLPEKDTKLRQDMTKRFTAGFIRGITGGALTLPKWERAMKPPKAAKTPPEKTAENKSAQKLTTPEAKANAQDLSAKLTAETERPVASTDQATEAALSASQEKSAEKKALVGRLDEVGKKLDEIEKKEHSNGGILSAIVAAVAGALAFFKKGLGAVMRVLKPISEGVVKIVGKLFGAVASGVRAVARGATKLGKGALGAVRKGWSKLGGAAANVTKKVVGKDALKVAEKMGAKSVLKKIPGLAIAAGLGFGAYDLMKGNAADAAEDVASGVVGSIPGVGTAASIAMDTGWAAHNMSKATTATPAAVPTKPTATAVPTPVPAKLTAATQQAQDTQAKEKAQSNPTAQPPIVIQGGNTTKVVQMPAKTSGPILISVRNPETTIGRLNASLWDDAAGWGGISRL